VAGWLGNPGLARAVGNALHRNPRPYPLRSRPRGQTAHGRSPKRGLAPEARRLVPCHRVVRADGSLGGFAFGTARKRRLLEQEGWRAPRD